MTIYFNEFYFRIIYLVFSLILLSFTCYFFFNDVFLFYILPVVKTNLISFSFIFIEPQELFWLYFSIILVSLIIYNFPYIIFAIFDFLKQSFYYSEWKDIQHYSFYFLFSYIVIILLSWNFGLSIFWSFFLSFKNVFLIVPIYFELSILKYFSYVISISIILNMLQFLFFITILYLFNFNYTTILSNKKYIIVLIILFSTLITPPDVVWQIFLFSLLYICFEFINFFIIFLILLFLEW